MRYCLLILSAFALMSSCTKMEDTKSRGDILRESKWQVESGSHRFKWVISNPVGTDPNDIKVVITQKDSTANYNIPECAQDDFLIFKEATLGTHTTGENICNINETADMEFRWGFTNGEKGMYIYDANEIFESDVNAEIIEFYDDKFAIRYLTVTSSLLLTEYDPVSEQLITPVYVNDTVISTFYFKKAGSVDVQ